MTDLVDKTHKLCKAMGDIYGGPPAWTWTFPSGAKIRLAYISIGLPRPGWIRESGKIQAASFFSFRPLGKISFPNQLCRVARGNQDAGRHELDRRRCFTEALTSAPILKSCEGEYVAIIPNCRIFRVSFYCFWDTRANGVVSIKRIG
jgi:hypothetical protein